MAGLHQAETPTPDHQADIDALMRRFVDEHRPRVVDAVKPSPVATVARDVPARRDFDMATELLDRAAQAFDLLINRCQQLEHDLEDTSERARGREIEQNETIDQWKRLASELKAQAEASERSAVALKARCEAAEARAATAEQKAAALERASAQAANQAALAENLSTKLHDKVVTAFGIGSRAHPVLEAVATKAAAE